MKTQALDSRVGRLEGVVETLTNEVQDTTKAVRTMAESFGSFKEDVLDRIGAATAPKWSQIATLIIITLSIFALCGTIVTIVLSGQSDSINQNRLAIQKIHEHSLEVSFNNGVISAWKEATDDKINDIKIRVNRSGTTNGQPSIPNDYS